MSDEKWLTPKTVAPMLGIAEQTLRLRRLKSWKGDPGPPWYRLNGRIRYKEADVLAYIERCFKAEPQRRLRPLPPPP